MMETIGKSSAALALIFSLVLFLQSLGAAHSTEGLSEPPKWREAPPTKNIELGYTPETCPPSENGSWRNRQKVLGVSVEKSQRCMPDNPQVVAAVTRGTNEVTKNTLKNTGLSEDAVRKGKDLDRDGDPDVINISLEVAELNGWSSATGRSAAWEIAPGIKPGFWVFAPETRGMATEGSAASELIRMPSPAIRVEENDRVRVTLENTHYFPHTIHFHGVDHPFRDRNGEGNDGVPQTSGEMVMPGKQHTYNFQPGQPGTFFYHCHVQPSTHVLMGLNGMFIVSKEMKNNTVQTFNIGNGKIRNPSKAVDKKYDQAYDMLYQGVDSQLHNILKKSDDPRVIAEHINRKYDITERTPDYFLLNGLSFPYTVRESQVVVKPNELTKMRILNSGSETISIHTHGHRPVKTHVDGIKLDDPVRRDVFSITPAQRLDLKLNTTTDDLNSYGRGTWFFHNHREKAVTNNGIAPGGDITLISYESFLKDNGIPRNTTGWNKYFSKAYYEGKVPVWHGRSMPTYLGEAGKRNAPASILGILTFLGASGASFLFWRWFK